MYIKTIPFVYLIGWKKLDTWYCGVRYKRGCSSQDLWKTYFTSSKYVKEFRQKNGEPDHIEILKEFTNKKDALSFEEQKLIEFDVLHKDNWLNRSIKGEKFSFSNHTEETKKRIAEAHLGKTASEETKLKQSLRRLGRKFHPHSEETRLKISAGNIGKKKKPHTEENKLKISNALKGIKRKPLSEEHKRKIAEARKRQIISHSEETKRKIGASVRRSKSIGVT